MERRFGAGLLGLLALFAEAAFTAGRDGSAAAGLRLGPLVAFDVGVVLRVDGGSPGGGLLGPEPSLIRIAMTMRAEMMMKTVSGMPLLQDSVPVEGLEWHCSVKAKPYAEAGVVPTMMVTSIAAHSDALRRYRRIPHLPRSMCPVRRKQPTPADGPFQ